MITSLDIMLENYLFPQLEIDSDNASYQHDGAPPHWKLHGLGSISDLTICVFFVEGGGGVVKYTV